MLEYLCGRASDRKLRLFACACCRRVWHLLAHPRLGEAVEVGERFADGQATAWQLRNAYKQPFIEWGAFLARGRFGRSETSVQADMLRDLFGNLFRPAPREPTWLTHTVVSLARAAYDQRTLPAGTLDPARLAVLADALEEAGCTSADILAHLRGPGPHFRGCWSLDLLLGRN
jgi:hypothetical protein